MSKYIYGADTETYLGKPMTLQFYSEDTACDTIIWVNEKDSMEKFLRWCKKLRNKTQHIIYIHNLKFDIIELFWGRYHELGASEFQFTSGDWTISGCYGAPTFARLRDRDGRIVMLIDSFSFFRGSLAQAATLFCPDLPKLKRPKYLGEKIFNKSDINFAEYAMRDAVVAYHIGKNIELLHREFDLTQCVSVADLAARIFRHRFLTYTIPQPNRAIIEGSLLSYHGGKNNITVPTGWYENVTALDVKSAYPHAMQGLPAFSNEKLYRKFTAKRACTHVPEYGVYCVSGSVAQCKWPSLFSHQFKPLSGRIDSVWIQGFELNESLRSGELKPSKIIGYFYDSEKDFQAPALCGFCDDFYQRKESEKDKVKRFMYKLILNSISGKFIQTRKKTLKAFADLDTGGVTEAGDLVAGGLFHPFIASAITAHTRARIHALEHRYSALHTATDGIFTQSKKLPTTGDGLGALAIEGQGTLLLVRNKLYVLYADKGEGQTSYIFKNKVIQKRALHGFQGTVMDLEKLVASGRRKYEISKPNTLKDSIKRKLVPNEFVKQTRTLKVGNIPVR